MHVLTAGKKKGQEKKRRCRQKKWCQLPLSPVEPNGFGSRGSGELPAPRCPPRSRQHRGAALLLSRCIACVVLLFLFFFLSQKNSKRNSVAAACDKPLPLSHAATCRGPQHRPGSGMGSQRRARVWDEILEIWANEALQGGRCHAFGVASAWSPIQVPPSCAFLALPTVSSPQHRPATSPSWQESQGANKRAMPLVFKHTSAGARG